MLVLLQAGAWVQDAADLRFLGELGRGATNGGLNRRQRPAWGRREHVVVENSRVRGRGLTVLLLLGVSTLIRAYVPGRVPALSWVDWLLLQLPEHPETDGLLSPRMSQGQDSIRLLVKAY